MYEYRGVVLDIIDERCLKMHIDLGFNTFTNAYVNIGHYNFTKYDIPRLRELLFEKTVWFVSRKIDVPDSQVYEVYVVLSEDRELFLLEEKVRGEIINHPV